MAHGAPGRAVAALGSAQGGDRLLHQGLRHGQPGAHGNGQQAFFHRGGDVGHGHAHAHAHALGHGHGRGELVSLVAVHVGGPFALGLSSWTPEAYQKAGLERGTAASSSTTSGDNLKAQR